MWEELFASFLLKLGYKQSLMDKCFFIKYVDAENYCKLGTHVDDTLLTGKGKSLFLEFEAALSDQFAGYTKQEGDKLTHLGITMVRDRENFSVTLSQTAMIDDLLERMGMTDCKPETMPYGSNLMKEDESNPPVDRTEYLSAVMSCMHITRCTRHELFFVVEYLASKGIEPKLKHWKSIKRVIRFLKGTKEYAKLYKGRDTTVSILADCSHAIHIDARGHGCIEIRIGRTIIYVQCGKLKANTIHSTESEMLNLRDAVTYVPYIIHLADEMRLHIQLPIKVYQDNTSTIHWAVHGGNFKKAKHVLVAIYFVKDFVDNKLVEIEYLNTNDMHADLNTKVLSEEKFTRFAMEYYS
jgi:hypothetical protein